MMLSSKLWIWQYGFIWFRIFMQPLPVGLDMDKVVVGAVKALKLLSMDSRGKSIFHLSEQNIGSIYVKDGLIY